VKNTRINTVTRSWPEIGPVFLWTAIYLLLGFAVSRLVSSQREQAVRLDQAKRQLEKYAAANEQLALSRERNRRARELHDTLVHTLSAVAVELEATSSVWDSDRAKARDLLVQSLKLTRDGLSATRRSMQSIDSAPEPNHNPKATSLTVPPL
jgi:signal transduction histidine kinase